ncbi:MAG: AAA family ATPase, partial [Clostridia bacterium]|nr:AAA family ATPase [Clostridia bacterium]
MKAFNTTAVCIPEKHYMVDLSERVKEIRKLVDAGKYFTINRARQYGKTTTIDALCRAIWTEYEVVSLSFEGIGNAGFRTEQSFVKAFARRLKREFRNGLAVPENIKAQILELIERKEEKAELDELFDLLQDWCYEAEKSIVLIIDEVDSATNNQVFLDFLSGLRDSYINRDTKGVKTFQSVILAGVTDVKHMKGMIRPEREHEENSPWNIAADFTIDMSLSETGIEGMLKDYEADHQTGMNTAAIARQIREYTNGYPFLVSRICQLI